jgi:hypothetical protein
LQPVTQAVGWVFGVFFIFQRIGRTFLRSGRWGLQPVRTDHSEATGGHNVAQSTSTRDGALDPSVADHVSGNVRENDSMFNDADPQTPEILKLEAEAESERRESAKNEAGKTNTPRKGAAWLRAGACRATRSMPRHGCRVKVFRRVTQHGIAIAEKWAFFLAALDYCHPSFASRHPTVKSPIPWERKADEESQAAILLSTHMQIAKSTASF